MRRLAWGFALSALAAGCGDSTGPVDPEVVERIAPRLAVMGFAVANGSQGRSFFDNALPCVRRGVVGYANTDAGRAVTFAGCDLGAGIVLDGTGQLRWGEVVPAADREPLCRFAAGELCPPTLTWAGELRVTLDGERQVQVGGFTVSDLAATGLEPVVLESLAITIGSTSVQVPDAGTVLNDVFDASGLTLTTIPNPGGALGALTEPDLRRLALHLAMDLAFFLLDETVEAGRGDHVHETPCGTSAVTIDANQFPHVLNTWTACPDRGLLVDGQFTMEWGRWEIDAVPATIRMDLAGEITVGGGVPMVSLSALRWTATVTGSPPAELSITLELEGPGGPRSWTATIPVDD